MQVTTMMRMMKIVHIQQLIHKMKKIKEDNETPKEEVKKDEKEAETEVPAKEDDETTKEEVEKDEKEAETEVPAKEDDETTEEIKEDENAGDYYDENDEDSTYTAADTQNEKDQRR